MTITARFASQCPRCQQQIAEGTRVEWERGSKARHLNCQPQTATVEPQRVRMAVENAGVYVLLDGTIAKVQVTQDKARTYAKRWVVIGGERLTEADTHAHGEYQYEPHLVEQVAATGRRMNLEEAKAFILRFGQCCRCGRHLKDATSVERGIGPVCVKYFSVGTNGADLLTQTATVEAREPVGAGYTRSRWTRPDDDELESAGW